MKIIIYITSILFIISCSEKVDKSHLKKDLTTNQKNATSHNTEKTNTSSHKKYIPINFTEKKIVKEGDSIKLFGGTNKYLLNNFGSDTCFAIVEKIIFSKPTGQLAFIKINKSQKINKHFAITLEYLNSNQGYKETFLEIWDKIPTKKEAKNASYNCSYPIHYDYDTIDINLGFNKSHIH